MRLKICWKKQWRNKTVFILRNKEAHYDLLDECLKNDIEDVREVIAARDLNIRDDMGVSMPERGAVLTGRELASIRGSSPPRLAVFYKINAFGFMAI